MKRLKMICGVVLLSVGLGLGAAGQTATTVLDIDPGVAMLGAGGAGISVVNGAETLYYNPAGLSELPGISFSSFYASYMGQASYSALALAFRNFAAGAVLFNSGGIQGYDDEGTPTDTLAYSNTAFLLGFGVNPSEFAFLRSLPFQFSIGAQIKGLTARLGEQRGSGVTFDLAFRTEFPDIGLGAISISDAAFGVTAVNLFGVMSYGDTQENFGMDLRLGASAKIVETILVAADLHLGGGLHFGIAYHPVPTLALRLGLITRSGVTITAGVGLDIQGFLLDYAFISGPVGGTHRVSLTIDFSGLDLGAFGRSLRRILP